MSNKNLGKLFSKIIFCGLCVSSIACLAQEDSLKEELTSENIVTEEIEKQEEPIKEESSSKNIVTEQIEKQEETIKIMSIYTWDDFTKEKNCQSFTKEIGQHDDLRELYQLLKPHCFTSKIGIWNKLEQTFRQEKQNLIVNQILKNDTSYFRYFKVIPYVLFDIQKTNAKGDNPLDLLDQAQTALSSHQLDTYITLIDKLPENWKKGLKKTDLILTQLKQIKENLDQINKGENNDN